MAQANAILVALILWNIIQMVSLRITSISNNHFPKRIDQNPKRFDIDSSFPGLGGARRRQTYREEDGDVYEFHRFQHYGFKTPAPSTFSLEGMLALLAPLATIPIIAGAALSGFAAILPTLTTDGMVKGRSRRAALLDSLEPMTVFNSSSWKQRSASLKKHFFKRELRDLDVIQKFLKQANPREDYNDEVMATYLQCSGMLGTGNHCLERLVCQFSDRSAKMASLEKDVSSLIIYTILNNKHIKDDFKDRLRKAAFFGRDTSGQCGMFACSKADFTLT